MSNLLQDFDSLRGEVSGCIALARILADRIARGMAGREVALAITNLQQAQMWLREAVELLSPQENVNREEVK